MHVHAEPVFAEADNDDNGIDTLHPSSARLTWVTTWDARCRVEYWVEETDDKKVIEETGPGANHRVILNGLAPDTTYFLPDQRLRKGWRSCRVHGQHLRDIPTDA